MKNLSINAKKVFGEFVGSAFISFLGLGFIVPFAVLGYVNSMYEFAVWFGIAFAITVIAFAPISGAHVNPGVTLAWALFGGFDKKLIIPYCIAQVLGWGVGVVPFFVMFDGVFFDWAVATNGNPATLFYCTTPIENIWSGAGLEIFLTAMLTFAIFLLLDNKMPNKPSSTGFPWAIGIVISLLIALGGGFTGTCINPARDLGPRIASLIYGLIKGYDISGIFAGGQWVMYIIAPMVGAVLGGIFHYGVVVKLLPQEPKSKTLEKERK